MALLIRMRNDAYFCSQEKCFGLFDATGYHLGPVVPPCADRVPLPIDIWSIDWLPGTSNSFKSETAILISMMIGLFIKNT